MGRMQHPNIVRLLDHGRAGTYNYLVMEWIQGPSLRKVIADRKQASRLPEFNDVLRWFEQMARGLAAIHAAGMVHRDIKPSNILIGADGVARITDLGLAKRVDVDGGTVTTTGHAPGTVLYMAPEQLESPDTVDARADQYALGVTFYEVLTGCRPQGSWPAASTDNPTVPQWFDPIIARLTARRREQRFSGMFEVLESLPKAPPAPPAREATAAAGKLLLRGKAWLDKKEYEKAIADYSEAIQLDPKLAVAWNNRGVAWLGKNEYDKAIADYTEAIRLDPKLAVAWNNRGLAWYHKKEYDKAIVDFTETVRLDPKHAAAWNNRGFAWLGKNEYDKAIADCTEAIRLDPKLAVAWNNRGVAWLGKNEYDNAIADYTEAIRLDPKLAVAWNNRGKAWDAKGKRGKAIADYKKAARLDPHYEVPKPPPKASPAPPAKGQPAAWKTLPWVAAACWAALHAFHHGESPPFGPLHPHTTRPGLGPWRGGSPFGDPLHPYRPRPFAPDLNPSSPVGPVVPDPLASLLANSHISSGDALYAKKNYDKAIADYNEAIRLNPKLAVAFNNRGNAWVGKMEYDKGIADFDEAIRLNPKLAVAFNNRGLAWYHKNEYDKAIADCTEAIRLNPGYADAFFLRGLVWDAKNEHGKAVADYKEAARLDPRFAGVERGDGGPPVSQPATPPLPHPHAPGPSPLPAGGSPTTVRARLADTITTRTAAIKLKLIPAGGFLMGSSDSDKDADEDEKPRHPVRITQPFYLGVHEVTQAQYEAVMAYNPSRFAPAGTGRAQVEGQLTERHPVEQVSWLNTVLFCNKLSELEGRRPFYRIDGDRVSVPDWDVPGFRLPTEAEWEYASRGGSTTRYGFGDDASALGDHAWFSGNSGGMTHPMGEKSANGFGLFDMHGNVWEWCWDGYEADYYKKSPADDPRGLLEAVDRVNRGGGWDSDPHFCRLALRDRNTPDYRNSLLGFRLALNRTGRTPDRPLSDSTTTRTGGTELTPNRPLGDTITARAAGINLKLIPAGEFLMGSSDEDKDAEADEKPQHRVRITRPFFLGVHEVTRGQFRRFVDEAGYQTEAEKDGKGGWGWNEDAKEFEQNARYTWREAGFEQTDEHPVVNVSWNDAVAFAEWLSRKEGVTYRLPTEAEWEYACRAGTTTRYFCGDDAEALAKVGNVADGTAKAKYPIWPTIAAQDGFIYTAPVGRYKPNAWGLFDMHGNVWEWCSDGYAGDYYKRSPVDDPPGPDGAAIRVFRGGSWDYYPRACRSAYRYGGAPDFRRSNLGFRLARFQSGG